MVVKNFEEELNTYIRASFPLVIISTAEEERAVEKIKKVCQDLKRAAISWDLGTGFNMITNHDNKFDQSTDPLKALEYVNNSDKDFVFVFKDFHDLWDNPQVRRRLRNVVQKLKFSKKSFMIITPLSTPPRELADDAVILNLELPDFQELSNVLENLLKTPNLKVNLTEMGKEKLIQAAMGMTSNQAERVFSKAIVRDGSLNDEDILQVTNEKKQIVRQIEALEFFSVTETPENVGGLEILKEWLKLREKAFTKEAKDYGLPSPKGIGLIGIPGTGKSLTAKMVAGLWRLPLLRFDVGSLFGSLVGESEERTRNALSVAEKVAPCVLWIDEIEKGLSTSHGDSGTSQRVLGSFLTWMQEKTVPCFVVATANNISALPPELMRKGRFDEIFFLDLPTYDERKEIFAVHLKKRKRFGQDFELDRLASESEGYVGAEIEQAVIDAMYIAYNDQIRDITTDDISQSLAKQVPLSISQKENVEGLRKWLKDGRAQSASLSDFKVAEKEFASVPHLEF